MWLFVNNNQKSSVLPTVSEQIAVYTLTLTHSHTVNLTVNPRSPKELGQLPTGSNAKICGHARGHKHANTLRHPGQAARHDSGLHLLTSVQRSIMHRISRPAESMILLLMALERDLPRIICQPSQIMHYKRIHKGIASHK